MFRFNSILIYFSFILFSSCSDQSIQATTVKIERFGDSGSFLKNAEKITLYSLDPGPDTPESSENGFFHGYPIYGSMNIVDASIIKSVYNEMLASMYSEEDDLYVVCFDPRHGIRAYQGGEARDYLICFQCGHLHVFEDTASNEYKRIALNFDFAPAQINALLDAKQIKRDIPDKD